MVDFFPNKSGGSEVPMAGKIHTMFDEKKVYKIATASVLLSSMKRKEVLKAIESATHPLPKEYYDTLYKELINNFVSFVQILPVSNDAKLGSLLDESLMRALYALQMQQKEKHDEEVDLVMSYVIFSAALLFDIGCVAENRTIIISEKNGSFIKIWDPFCDGAIREGCYYKIRHGGGLTPWSSRRSTITLACNLMPKIGFNWIYKNAHAFNIWLSLLVDDKEGAGALTASFEKARALLDEFKTSADFFVPVEIEEMVPKETQTGEDFLYWLKNELVNGKVAIGKVNGMIFLEGEEVLINEELFKRYESFAKITSTSKLTWQKVVKELGMLGIIYDDERINYSYAPQKDVATNHRQATARYSSMKMASSSLFGPIGKKTPTLIDAATMAAHEEAINSSAANTAAVKDTSSSSVSTTSSIASSSIASSSKTPSDADLSSNVTLAVYKLNPTDIARIVSIVEGYTPSVHVMPTTAPVVDSSLSSQLRPLQEEVQKVEQQKMEEQKANTASSTRF